MRAMLVVAVMLAGCCKVGATTTSIPRSVLEKHEAAELDRAGAGYVSAIARPPFVVVATTRVDRDEAVATIAWAGERLRRQLFDVEPAKPMTVWVFATEDDYRRGSSAVLGMQAMLQRKAVRWPM
jgi:hypothetical protein